MTPRTWLSDNLYIHDLLESIKKILCTSLLAWVLLQKLVREEANVQSATYISLDFVDESNLVMIFFAGFHWNSFSGETREDIYMFLQPFFFYFRFS